MKHLYIVLSIHMQQSKLSQVVGIKPLSVGILEELVGRKAILLGPIINLSVYILSLALAIVVATAARKVNVYDLPNMSQPEQQRTSLTYQTRCVRCYPNGTGPKTDTEMVHTHISARHQFKEKPI